MPHLTQLNLRQDLPVIYEQHPEDADRADTEGTETHRVQRTACSVQCAVLRRACASARAACRGGCVGMVQRVGRPQSGSRNRRSRDSEMPENPRSQCLMDDRRGACYSSICPG
jgi:hypothetical protein